MSHRIHLHLPDQPPICTQRLEETALAALRRFGPREPFLLNIALSDSETVRGLNREHRGCDEVTDVLSFAAERLPAELIDDLPCLGDIIIALDYTRNRARDLELDADAALCLLVAHGVLHLLGYDHDSESARQRMWRAQAEILRSLEIDAAIVARYGASDDEPARR